MPVRRRAHRKATRFGGQLHRLGDFADRKRDVDHRMVAGRDVDTFADESRRRNRPGARKGMVYWPAASDTICERAAFDVASVKPSVSAGNVKIINVEPGMLTIRGMSLKDLMQRAYGSGDALQISRNECVSGGANWCDDHAEKPAGN
jgi:hypothetical protein